MIAWRRIGGRRALGAAVAAVLFLSSGLAGGQGTPPPAPSLESTLAGPAREAYEEGRRRLAANDFAGALTLFTSVYRQVRDPRLLANIALSEKGLGHCARATELFDAALGGGAALFSPEQQRTIRGLVDACRPSVGVLHLAVTPVGAQVDIDGMASSQSTPSSDRTLDVGAHRVRVTMSGYRDYDAAVSVPPAGRADLVVTLESLAPMGGVSIRAGADDTVSLDGRVVGKGRWDGRVVAGPHLVVVRADGAKPYRAEIRVAPDQTRTLDVTLAGEEHAPTWIWATGAAIVGVGIIVAAVSVFHPASAAPAPTIAATAP